ncbi:MAG: hypothetical protein ACUVRJ_08630 [Candidatus Villigracilaceae bacterium]
MKRLWWVFLMILASACNPTAAVPTPTALAIVIPAAASPVESPPPPFPLAAPSPPPASPPVTGYVLRDERLVDGYAIRLWGDPADTIGYANLLLIEKTGIEPLQIEMASAIHPQTGSDLNNDGFPEVVIETYSGGAHCCFGTFVYSLRDAPLLILHKPESNVGGQFEDLNGDDIYEFITYDDLFAGRYCAYAFSPSVKVILAYDASKQRYLPASPLFPEQYAQDIVQHTDQAQGNVSDFVGDDGTPKCAVLPLVLDYLYLGQTEKAHQELLRLYPYPDAEAFWNEVLSSVQQSSLYTPSPG